MDDREVVAAIAAGDPAGIAAAYDKYAAALYGYCQWMQEQPAGAAENLRDTFVVASATIEDLTDADRLRPWLYALARREGQRRVRTTVPVFDGPDQADEEDEPEEQAPLHAWQATGEKELPDIRSDLDPAELLALMRDILDELPPREREAIELSLRHNMHDDDLAAALEVPPARAQALTERARGRLENSLGALLVARTGLQACAELGTVLNDWDGRLTEEARTLIATHVRGCQACTARQQGTLRQAALSGLKPLVPLPPGLRDQVLKLCSAATPDVVAYRQRATRRAESVWRTRISHIVTLMRWGSIRAHPGRAIAAVVVVTWVAAAAGFTWLTFGGSHAARAADTRLSLSPPSASPTLVTVQTGAPAVISRSASVSASPSLHVSRSPAFTAPPAQSSAPVFSSPAQSVKPSPSKSPSRSPSGSPSATPSKSPSGSPSATPSRSPTGSPSPTP